MANIWREEDDVQTTFTAVLPDVYPMLKTTEQSPTMMLPMPWTGQEQWGLIVDSRTAEFVCQCMDGCEKTTGAESDCQRH